jgi:hypothetical protein
VTREAVAYLYGVDDVNDWPVEVVDAFYRRAITRGWLLVPRPPLTTDPERNTA